MKKINIIFITISIIIIGGLFIFSLKKDKPLFNTLPRETKELYIVPTMQDIITANSAWVGTFQLVWNDLMKEIVKGDVIFNPQETMVANLNKQEFTTNMISDAYYYKKYGLKTLALKAEIEKGIKDKFNQESDILDQFDWSEKALNDPNSLDSKRYFFYVMLYRKFEFLKAFDKLENDKFGKYEDIKYFGTNNSSYEIREQFEILYYNSDDDFALLINTKTDDEVIFHKNPQGNTFKEIYDNMNHQIDKFKGDKVFNPSDKFKAPNISFNELREYTELENKPFPIPGGNGIITKALQTIQFYLDENGGKIKSEAGIDMKVTSSGKPTNSREFYLDNTFALFLREKGKSMPYFASRIDNITKFQVTYAHH